MKRKVLTSIVLCLVTVNLWAQSENILIQSDGSGTGSLIVGTENASLQLQVERYIPSNKWHIVSSPVSDQQLGAFISNGSINYTAAAENYDLAPYNEANNEWGPYTEAASTVVFGVGAGYSTRRTGAGRVLFSGTINSGDIDVPVMVTSEGGWNAVGNPYTSDIRAKGVLGFLTVNEAVLDTSYGGIYVWDQALGSAGDYAVITQAGYTFPPPGGETELEQNKLAVGQGFLIRPAASGTVALRRSMQLHAVTNAAEFKSAKIPWPAIRLTVNTGTMQNQTIVAFNNQMKEGLDPGYDVGKLKGNPELALYSQLVKDNGVEFAVQALPNNNYDTYRIPLGLDCNNGGFVTFTAESVDLPSYVKVILEDTKSNTFTRLDIEGAKYVAMVDPKSKGFGQFYLHTSEALITDVSEIQKSDFKVFPRYKRILIQGETDGNTMFRVYGIDGKMWYQNKAQNRNYNTIDASDFASGVYLLHINKGGNTSVHKLVLSGR